MIHSAAPDHDATPATARDAVGVPAHRRFDDSEFWRDVPGFATADRATFLDPAFQSRHSVTRVAQLRELLGTRVSATFLEDAGRGAALAAMNLRIPPYLLARINWDEPWSDPLRRQFIPLASQQRPDHPMSRVDALAERAHSPVPGLVHRYRDRALLLPLDVCPVYCRFCTRSYAIGGDTATLEKDHFRPDWQRWQAAIDHIAAHAEIEDVLVSGGDAFMLPAAHLAAIGRKLLAIDHVRRVRIATRGLAVMPMKIRGDREWTDALLALAAAARARDAEVCVHTHFNHPAELSGITRDALLYLYREGVTVRNQTVLLRGVNDNAATLAELVLRLGWLQVRPYYVHQHDLVPRVEELRTTVATACELERGLRGATAGQHTPAFVLDCPGGGGKRDIHSFDHYDRETGVSVWRSPAVDAGRVYLYFDPLELLPASGRERWARPAEHAAMIDAAIGAAGLRHLHVAWEPARLRTS